MQIASEATEVRKGAIPASAFASSRRLQEEGHPVQEVKGASPYRPAAATSATGVTAAWSSSPVRMR